MNVNSAPINQITDISTVSIENKDCKLLCLSITSIPCMLYMKFMKKA